VPLPRAPYAIALVVILALSVVPAHAQNDWKVFTHPTMGFSVSYPPGWVPHQNPYVNDPELKPLHLVIVGPSTAGVPNFQMGVVVISVPVPPNVTAEHVFDGADQPLRQQVGNARVLRVDHTKLNGIPASVLYATSHVRGTPVYANSRGYVVAGITALDSTELAAETQQLQAILASFRPGKGSLDKTAVVPSGPGQGVNSAHN
jgi:hypothetical protein